MHVGLIFAMEQENFTSSLFGTPGKAIPHPVFKITEFNKNNVKVTTIISRIGKAYAAAATTLLIEKFNVEGIINIGTCGGLSCNIGDIILSNQALYHDVDVTGFGYLKGALPGEPLIFSANKQLFDLSGFIEQSNSDKQLVSGLIATGDQFVNDFHKVIEIAKLHSEIKGLDMEAAAIAQICNQYHKDFILIKKISDLADKCATESFKEEITNFEERIIKILDVLLDYLILSNKNN